MKILVLVLFISSLIKFECSIAQCRDAFFYYPEKGIPSCFLLNYLQSVQTKNDSSIILTIDTLSNPYTYPQYFCKGRYKLSSSFRPSRKKLFSIFLDDTWLRKTYLLGESRDSLNQYIYASESFLYHFSLVKPVVYFFNSGMIRSLKQGGEIKGEDKDSLFLCYTTGLKIKKNYYRQRQLVKVEPTGTKVMRSDTSSCLQRDPIVFYNNKYFIRSDFLKHFENDCNFYDTYITCIYYYNKLIDTFTNSEVFSPFYEKDTLSIYFRKKLISYYKTKKTIDIDANQLNTPVSSAYYSFCTFIKQGDKILIISPKLLDASPALKEEGNKSYTLNHLPSGNKKYEGFLVMAFNAYTKKFLGYPKIVFSK